MKWPIKKIVEFGIARSISDTDNALKKGWKLYGDPAFTVITLSEFADGERGNLVAQGLIRIRWVWNW